MSIDNKPLDAIDESDLLTLIDGQVPEGKSIECKLQLPGQSHDAVRELLADVSSFANAFGGHLIFGMDEEGGVPVQLPGLTGIDIDQVKQRFENSFRDNIEPRIPGIGIHAVLLQSSNMALIVHIPKSWAPPHVVNYQRHWRFYSRNSAGKYPLDVPELRAVFSLSESLAERIRNFRADRLSQIISRQTPVQLSQGAAIVLHIIPFNSFDPGARIDVAPLARNPTLILPMSTGLGGWNHRYNLDGILSWQTSPESTSAETYLQVFRNGIIEAVDAHMIGDRDGERLIPSRGYESELIEALPRLLDLQRGIGVEPPLFVMLSLLGVAGYTMAVNPTVRLAHRNYPIDREQLILPEMMVDSYGHNPSEILRPAFDAIWNAAGFARSLNYSDEGVWGAGPNS